jgi:hypothetical protein
MFDVCTTGDTAHIDTIFKFLSHTRVTMGASIFLTVAMIRAFRSARSRGNGGTNTRSLTYPRRKNSLAVMSGDSNHRLTRVIFHQTKRLLPRSSHFLITYTLIAWRQKCELRWKTTYWGKNLSCSFYLYRFRKYVSYGFCIIKIFVILKYIIKRLVYSRNM